MTVPTQKISITLPERMTIDGFLSGDQAIHIPKPIVCEPGVSYEFEFVEGSTPADAEKATVKDVTSEPK
jgi:hypothetical protein